MEPIKRLWLGSGNFTFTIHASIETLNLEVKIYKIVQRFYLGNTAFAW